MNSVSLCGYLDSEPQLLGMPGRDAREFWLVGPGRLEKHIVYVKVLAFPGPAERLAGELSEGDRVAISFHLRSDAGPVHAASTATRCSPVKSRLPTISVLPLIRRHRNDRQPDHSTAVGWPPSARGGRLQRHSILPRRAHRARSLRSLPLRCAARLSGGLVASQANTAQPGRKGRTR
jgi:hypothetical protein